MLQEHKRKKSFNKPTIADSENIQPSTCFNTRGYFSSQQPYSEDYLKIKQEVFRKYRNTDTELVFIDPKMTKPAVFIQRGMLKPNNKIYNEPAPMNSDKVLNNFLKNYKNRKERREHKEEERYPSARRQSFGASNIDLNPLCLKSRAARSITSRVSTTRSMCSSNKQN